jgi:hypothetical protein
MMWTRLSRFFSSRKTRYTRVAEPSRPKLLLTQACLEGLQVCLAPEMHKGHEGIAYLLGRTDGAITLGFQEQPPDFLRLAECHSRCSRHS